MTTPEWHHLVLVLLAYLIGGLSPGYWLALTRGIDLRSVGTNSTGASNAARVLGQRGFYAVIFLDVLKGLLVTVVASHIMSDDPDVWQFAAAFAVVAGHIWPVWLGFRGGKGVSTFYGAWCPLLNWHGLIPAAIIFVLCLISKYVFRRSFKNTWLVAQVLYPAIIWWLTRNHPDHFPITLLSTALILLIWFAHRRNIAGMFPKKAEELKV